MPIVPAFVGATLVHRAVRERGLLLHGEAVHVGPQGDEAPVHTPIRDQARARTVAGRIAVLLQPGTHQLLRPLLAKAELGVLVDVVADLAEPREKSGEARVVDHGAA